jgi:GNAT superfamily N-acetyltransferase
MTFATRVARLEDADAIAAVFSPSLRLLTFLPELHTVAEDRWFIENVILKECKVTLAGEQGNIISFLALDGNEIRLLHSHPNHLRRGAGAQLLAEAQASGSPHLELWCFQQNHLARAFYECHGFRPTRFTNGEGNEEMLPDLRYRWERL